MFAKICNHKLCAATTIQIAKLLNKRIIISVTSDLSTDQRVHRTAQALHGEGYNVLVAGRLLKNSLSLADRIYKTKRFKLWFNKGPLFYGNYNLRLFFFLLFNRADVLLANDLDTLLPNFLIAKLKSQTLVYDNHEYFTGVPELADRPFVRAIWKRIERWIFPKLKYVYTVNESIANLYKEEYRVNVAVVRNLSVRIFFDEISLDDLKTKQGLPLDKFIIILQGNGINIDRGGEEAVQAMQYVEQAVLLIAGSGDVIPVLKKMVTDLEIENKIIFKDRMPFSELINYTRCASLGLTLDKATNINYRYSLPNKLFDYIQCSVPVLASDLIEVRRIIEYYNTGAIIQSHEPKTIAGKINSIINDTQKLQEWKKNSVYAASELNWENEKVKLIEIIKKAAQHKIN